MHSGFNAHMIFDASEILFLHIQISVSIVQLRIRGILNVQTPIVNDCLLCAVVRSLVLC